MFRYLIIELLLPLLAFLLVRSIIQSIFQTGRDVARRQAEPQPPAQPTVIAGGDLKKDPVCGTYVSTSLALTHTVKGELVYFCSRECRDKFVG